MAQVSIVTAARRELAADALNPDAREFLPWWRLGGSRKVLSADAPEYIPGGQAAASAAAHGAVAAAPKKTGMGRRAARRSANDSGQDAEPPRAAFFKSHRSQWEETVKRTIFVKYIDHNVTEDLLACVFQLFGTVVDCRICGDPTSGCGLRFGFVELQHEDEALASLDLDGSVAIGRSPLSVSRSRTAICPINPKFLPQSEAEWEMCFRTIYCTNISKIVTSSNLKAFCEAYFGKVSRLKLLDNEEHSTNIAFIEFTEIDGAIAALGSGGIYVDGIPIRMCPSKSPIKTNCFGNPTTLEGSLVDIS